MLPQLATETFPSQVFWVVLGFFCVYLFMAFFAVPKLTKILEQRKSYIDNLVSLAKNCKEQSEKIEKESNDLLMETKRNLLKAEMELMEEFEKAKTKEKQQLSVEIMEKSRKEIDSIQISSDQAFKEISSDLDDLLKEALTKMENQKS